MVNQPNKLKENYMALISCPECSIGISGSALKCPKCGFKLKEAQRTLWGKIIIGSFIGFNVLMALLIFVGMNDATKNIERLQGAEQAGAAIGTGIGMVFLGGIWLFGAIILGLFALVTKPKD